MSVKEKLENAEKLYVMAVNELKDVEREPAKLRDASEKAWGATAIATDALIRFKTGERVISGRKRTSILMDLVKKRKVTYFFEAIYRRNQKELHGNCFYDGFCEPREEIEDSILQTKDYINRIKRMIK